MGGKKKSNPISKAAAATAKVHAKTNLASWAAKKDKRVAKVEKQVSKYNGGMGFKDPAQAMNEMIADPSKFGNQWSEIFGIGGTKKKGNSANSTPVGPNGQPINMPQYQSIAKGGVLGDNYRMADANPWLKMQTDKQGIENKLQMNNAIQNQLSSQGAAESALAMRGGLSSGSRERLARSGMRDLNLQKQGVYTQGNVNKLGLESDAFDKNQAANQFNIQTLLKDKEMQESSAQSKYQADMAAWAANKQADATANAGKK
jgi:hypothetical protein